MPNFKKAPAWMGKDLTLNVGRSDMRILDRATYTDPRLMKFVGMGFMVEVKETVAAPKKAPKVATPAAEAPVSAEANPAVEAAVGGESTDGGDDSDESSRRGRSKKNRRGGSDE
jgi:hypothetical protein